MKINIDEFNQHYFDKDGKFKDNSQEGIKIFPFNTSMSTAYNKICGLQGITGSFFRLWQNDGSEPIEGFEESIKSHVVEYLEDNEMSNRGIDDFIMVAQDILFIGGVLNITNPFFLKYLPLLPQGEHFTKAEANKYKLGQNKIANYLFSMVPDNMDIPKNEDKEDLFSMILQNALTPQGIPTVQEDKEFTVLNFIKESFIKDLRWMSKQDSSVKVRYFPYFLYFYVSLGIIQGMMNLKPDLTKVDCWKPQPLYYILKSEKISMTHDAVVSGWNGKIPKWYFDKIFGRIQALDILNCVLGGNVGFYPDILEKLNETPFEENRNNCNEIMESYQNKKRELLDSRGSEKTLPDPIDTEVSSYTEFVKKMDELCIRYQSTSYISRMRKKFLDVLTARFLQQRRGLYVLTLDNDMLIFLIALVTHGKKMKLEIMYRNFNEYGIHFNRNTRIAIENYLLKLNLLDRKSDSGETQYVQVVL